MKYSNPLAIAVALFCLVGLWGCTQQKTGIINARIQDLEARYAKLEEDYRTLQANHEHYRKRLNQAETQRAALEKEKNELTANLETAKGEREIFRKQATERTAERDSAQAHLAQFSKELQGLVGRMETALNTAPNNPHVTILPASRRTEDTASEN